MKYVFLIFYATKYSTIRQQIYFFRVVFFFTVKLCVAEIVNVEPILVLRNGRSLQTTFVQSPGFVMVHTTYGRRLVFSFFVAPIVIFVPASVNSWLFFVLCPNQLGKDCHRLISPTVVACENARTHTRQSHVLPFSSVVNCFAFAYGIVLVLGKIGIGSPEIRVASTAC